MAKLCHRGKAAAKRKFKVYPSAYANMYASAVCSGKVTPGGKKKRKNAMGKKTGGLTKEQIEKLKKIMKKRIGEKEMIPFKKLENSKKPKLNRGIFNPERFEEMEKEKRKKFIEKFKKAGSPEFSKGGRAALKKGSKFPDHSGDGKITQKDILMAKGVIPKKKNNKKVI